MPRSVLSDPIRNFKFKVTISPDQSSGLRSYLGTDSIETGFSVVSGLTVQNEMIAYREGGMNTHPHKMIGQSDFGPVTFTKGVFADNDALYKWQTFMHTWAQGDGNPGAAATGNSDYRCDITIHVFDHPVADAKYELPNQDPVAHNSALKMAYKLHNCWPASYYLGDLNAGDSSILIQQMVVNHEGFEIAWSSPGPNGTATVSNFS